MKKRILIFYDYFLPGYKAGGPVQSLINLITTLQNEYEFIIITSAYDIGSKKPYAHIKLNNWNAVKIAECNVMVWYADKSISYNLYHQILKNTKADIIFFNCMYSFRFFLYPILKKKQLFSKSANFIISPRGVLQKSALAVKSIKKNIYLTILKKTMLLKNMTWHATGIEEAAAIREFFGDMVNIKMVGNLPKRPVTALATIVKQQSLLRLVHLSLITSVKNLKSLIQLLKGCSQKISLDIYGPIIDESYWNECNIEMSSLPLNIQINYKGNLSPQKVQETLQQYDAMILLTKGENFGHALFESLSVGRPIITSYFTPWNELTEKKAGWNVDIDNLKSISLLLNELASLDNESWQPYCTGALQLANEYYFNQSFKTAYQQLFQ